MKSNLKNLNLGDGKQAGGRRLAALMFTDMVGYSSLTARDEMLSLQLVAEQQALIRKVIEGFGGQKLRTIGDGCFIEFGSAVESVLCAREIQTRIRERNFAAPSDQQIKLRVGIHLGDIIDFDGDTYGDGVNIAARIETKASPGGIYLTRQIYDQVIGLVENKLEPVGKIELKNIPKPVEVFRLRLAWEDDRHAFSVTRFLKKVWTKSEEVRRKGTVTKTVSTTLLGLLVVAFLTSTAWYCANHMRVENQSSEVISSPWKYSVLKENGEPGEWHDYNEKQRYTYAESINGPYLLKTEFRTSQSYQTPAIIVGQLSHSSSVFLNGTLIGQGNQFDVVQAYTFDRSFLRADSVNELVIKSPAPASGILGFYIIPELGLRVGEAAHINNAALLREFSFYSKRALYLVMAMGMLMAFFVYFLQGKNQSQAVYGALFCCLLILSLIYYNAILTSHLYESTRILIKSIALAGTSFVLFSGYLSATPKNRLEPWNNFLAFGVLGALLFGMFPGHTNLHTTLLWQHAILHFTLFYSIAWLSYSMFGTLKFRWEMIQKQESWVAGTAERLFPVILGVFSFVLIWTALRSGYSPIALQEPERETIRDFAQTVQFFFGVITVGGGCVGFVAASGSLVNARERDKFLLKINHAIASGANVDETVLKMQILAAEFVGAERSTVYTLTDGILNAAFVHASPDAANRVLKSVENLDGPLGYVIESKTPLFLKNIGQDSRFKSHLLIRNGKQSFKTGACMILPLVVANEIVGVITFADPEDGKEFSQGNFFLMQLISKDLGLLLKSNSVSHLSAQDTAFRDVSSA
jgi:class 3 adenylate cyclase